MVTLITKEFLDEVGACFRKDGERHSDENLEKLSGGKEGLTPLEVADHPNIPINDKIWLLGHPLILGDRYMEPVNLAVGRAKKYANDANAANAAYANAYANDANAYAAYANAANAAYAAYANAANAAYANAYANAAYAYANAANAAYAAYANANAAKATEQEKQLADIRRILEEGVS